MNGSALETEPVVYRSRGQSRAFVAFGTIAIIAAIIGLIATWGGDRFGSMVIIAACGVLIGAFLVLRMGRAALYVGHDGVRIVNVWRTHVLSWDEIREFAKRSYGPAKVTTVDHRTFDIFAIQQSNWANMRNKTGTPADAMIAELNALVDTARDGSHTIAAANPPQTRQP